MATKASASQGSTVRGSKSGARAQQRDAKAETESKARRYDPAETRTRILEAAYLLFGTRGYGNTGTADIATQADVSEGSIFYHFGSKRALLVELGKQHGQKLVAAMQAHDPLDSLSFATSLNRCFDFCEVNNIWETVENTECPTGKPISKGTRRPSSSSTPPRKSSSAGRRRTWTRSPCATAPAGWTRRLRPR